MHDPAIERTAEKNLGGRPTLYRPEYCEAVVDAGRRGLSLTGFAGSVGVSRQTVIDWQGAHPEFSDACSVSKAVRAMAYEEKAWSVASGEGGNGAAAMIQFALKNIAPADYADTQNHRVGGPNGEALPSERTVIILPSNDRDQAAERTAGGLPPNLG